MCSAAVATCTAPAAKGSGIRGSNYSTEYIII